MVNGLHASISVLTRCSSTFPLSSGHKWPLPTTAAGASATEFLLPCSQGAWVPRLSRGRIHGAPIGLAHVLRKRCLSSAWLATMVGLSKSPCSGGPKDRCKETEKLGGNEVVINAGQIRTRRGDSRSPIGGGVPLRRWVRWHPCRAIPVWLFWYPTESDRSRVMRAVKRTNVRTGSGSSYKNVNILEVGERSASLIGSQAGSGRSRDRRSRNYSSTDRYWPRPHARRRHNGLHSEGEPSSQGPTTLRFAPADVRSRNGSLVQLSLRTVRRMCREFRTKSNERRPGEHCTLYRNSLPANVGKQHRQSHQPEALAQ